MHSLHKILWLGISCLTLHTSLAQTVQHTLNNGLNVIIEEDHRAPVVQTQLWYKVGSMDEQAGKTGLSHALEHIC
ncbi:insulinase family protein [Kingella kingae]|uniref:insulinase family protein n=1 Tax=Kingella kingae TaxID=504 RepID=UPI00030F43FD|nr:insulinase family protein [Kingella kingae]MBD3613642.1 insulinase family protein [Kingella kingae]MBD3632196.1 insulinase family protein [Kingella kingae]MBD3659712.1 insulinase family protein [Kingella kingae]MDK4527256.1 insulinase family protein [Kingella kingae]MDK4527995.1 insulinase family protein [Kingella kingae]